jgi:hypothetical protein
MPDRLTSALDRALEVIIGAAANEGWPWLASDPLAKLRACMDRGATPSMPASSVRHPRPVTIVTVRYDGLCESNLLASPVVSDPAVRLAIVDDPFGLREGSLARALRAGIRQVAVAGEATGLVALVGQDCYLPEGWLAAAQAALESLEETDEGWALAGVAGLDESGRRVGHLSEPWGQLRTFAAGRRWSPALSLSDHVLLMRAGRLLDLDDQLPGFEGVGVSLAQRARAAGGRAYVIDAPVIVERADHAGRPVRRGLGSRRVRGQLYRQQRVQREVTLEYLAGPEHARDASTLDAPFRWDWNPLAGSTSSQPPETATAIGQALDGPLILLGKGGGGSRLASVLAEDCGVAVGRVNVSGDCLDMVPAVYAGVLRHYDCPAEWQRARVADGLRQAAAAMLTSGWSAGRPWGFKVPESLLLLPQLHAAFPGARYLFLARHPVSTCLRRFHMTAEPDNPIGRASLAAAYRAAGLSPADALGEPVELRSARVTLHQVGTAIGYLRSHVPADRRMEIRFEDLLARPVAVRDSVAAWLGLAVAGHQLERAVDSDRARRRSAVPPDTVRRIEQLLAPLVTALGFDTDHEGGSRG